MNTFDDLANVLGHAPLTQRAFRATVMPLPLPSVHDTVQGILMRRPKLRVSEGGHWFEVTSMTGETRRAACSDHPTIRQVLGRLAHERAIRPGKVVSTEELLAATWTGEQITSGVAGERLASALNALREAGLGDLILSRREGYLLNPKIEFALAL